MAEILATLLVLACPVGMASMMFLPALVRRVRRHPESAGTDTTGIDTAHLAATSTPGATTTAGTATSATS
jgi:hypothetical protein